MRISDWSSDVCSSDLAVAEGVQGKAVTPFLLARLEGLTGGASLDANVALVLNNARLAAEIATAYAALQAALPPSPSALSRGYTTEERNRQIDRATIYEIGRAHV